MFRLRHKYISEKQAEMNTQTPEGPVPVSLFRYLPDYRVEAAGDSRRLNKPNTDVISLVI